MGEEGVATVKSTMDALEKIDQLGSLRYGMTFFSLEVKQVFPIHNFIRQYVKFVDIGTRIFIMVPCLLTMLSMSSFRIK